jgi:hypothetical protein
MKIMKKLFILLPLVVVLFGCDSNKSADFPRTNGERTQEERTAREIREKREKTAGFWGTKTGKFFNWAGSGLYYEPWPNEPSNTRR